MQSTLDQFIDIILHKSQACTHGCCCAEDIITATAKTLRIAYILKTCLSLIGFLLKLKSRKHISYKIILELKQKVFWNADNARFCGFMSLYTLVSKLMLCVLRGVYKRDRSHYAFIAGFVGGQVSLAMVAKQNRKVWALYLLARAMDTQFRNGLQKNKYSYMIIYAFMQFINGYAYFYEEDCFGEEQAKVYRKFQNFNPRELHFRELTNLSKFAK